MSEANTKTEDGKSRKREMEKHTEDEDDDIFHCPVCLEEFEVTGDRLPRFLSCAHSICTKCVEDMLKPKTLVCPLCRKKHKAENGICSFPRNKYILPSLKSRNEDRKRKKEFSDKLKSVKQAISRKIDICCREKDDVLQDYACCQKAIQDRKIEIVKILDKMNDRVQREKKSFAKRVDIDVSAMQEDIALLENMESEMKTKEISLDGLMNSYKIINDIKENNSKKRVLGWSNCTVIWFSVRCNEDDTEKLCGTLHIGKKDELSVNKVKKERSPTPNTSASSASDSVSEVSSNEEPAKFSCTVEKPFQLGFVCNGEFEVLHDSTIAVAGHISFTRAMLKRFTKEGKEVDSALLNDSPAGIAEVMLNGRWTLALPGLNNKNIEFLDVLDFARVVHTYDFGPDKLDTLCVSSSSTYLYVMGKQNQDLEVHILDCDGPEPKPCGSLQSVQKLKVPVYDMCVVEHEYQCKDLLVVAGIKISAFDVESDAILWSTDFRMDVLDRVIPCCTVTTDGCGHLFVTDENNRGFHVFHVADGRYSGELTGLAFPSPQRLARLKWIPWANEMMCSQDSGKTLYLYKVIWISRR